MRRRPAYGRCQAHDLPSHDGGRTGAAKIETQNLASNGHALTEKNSDEIENYVGVPLGPVLLDYLNSDHGHQLANRVVELLEG